MKWIIAILLAAFTVSAFADQYVRGYTRKDGTYVAPHWRSDADGRRDNNWSSRGNVNPYTGERGYRDPYAPQQPTYPTYPSDTRPRSRY